MNKITIEDAQRLGIGAGLVRSGERWTEPARWGMKEIHALCNAAIEWYIAQQAAREPVAYFDFQDHGFYWSPNVKIGDVPVIRKVAPMPLYSEPDMYKSESKTNTSQERVKKSEKSEQVPLTDEQCDKVLQRIDEWATGYGAQEYGLPLFWMPNRARDVLREALEIKV